MVTWGAMVRPMLCQPADEPFDSPDWIFEVKWDGTRIICFHGDRTWFQNRRFKDITERYPEIRVGGGHRAIYDGEIVIVRDGLPSFRALQEREHIADPRTIQSRSVEMPATYVVFDILYLDGEDLTPLPLKRRKEILKENLQGTNVEFLDFVEGQGRGLFEAVRSKGLEGIIAKRISSPYKEGTRSKHWLKIKATKTIDAVVCGLTEGTGTREGAFGALLLGLYSDDGRLVYVGKVGTGFDAAILREIVDATRGIEGPCPFTPLPPDPRPVRWLLPRLVCEVRYLEFTWDSALRAPSFVRLRSDKPPGDCLVPPGVSSTPPERRPSLHWGRKTRSP